MCLIIYYFVLYLSFNYYSGNLVIKAGGDAGHVGSENDSCDDTVDYSNNVNIRTPAQSITEDSFSPTSTTVPLTNSNPSDPKKPKISPSKGKLSSVSSGNNSNSKASSPSKVKRATPLKGKSINLKK